MRMAVQARKGRICVPYPPKRTGRLRSLFEYDELRMPFVLDIFSQTDERAMTRTARANAFCSSRVMF